MDLSLSPAFSALMRYASYCWASFSWGMKCGCIANRANNPFCNYSAFGKMRNICFAYFANKRTHNIDGKHNGHRDRRKNQRELPIFDETNDESRYES